MYTSFMQKFEYFEVRMHRTEISIFIKHLTFQQNHVANLHKNTNLKIPFRDLFRIQSKIIGRVIRKNCNVLA